MKIVRSAGRTTRLRRPLKILVLSLACVVGLSGCPQLLCDFGVTDLCETYTVIYSANGADSGTPPVDGATYQEGDTATVLPNVGGLSRSGFSFEGWNTAANGGGVLYSVGETVVSPLFIVIAAANVTLYADWSEDEEEELAFYVVTYSPNGATSGDVPLDSNNYEAGQTVTALSNTGNLARTRYSFAGWNTTADGNGTTYTSGNIFEIGSAHVTLYATWSQMDEREFTYTGGVQTFTVPGGVNQIEIQAWGAQGGALAGCNSDCPRSAIGGKGGYSKGVLSVTPGATVYVYVGGQGEGHDSPNSSQQVAGTKSGGWNGGGDSQNSYPAAGGGGASDVRYGGTAIGNRKIVAGGGGGGGNAQNETQHSNGGAGGGLSGQTMDPSTQFANRTPGAGATQNAGNANGVGSSAEKNHAGGGGGGYYGGLAGANSTGAGGGSGYIDIGGVSNGETIAGNLSMPKPDGGTMTGREGNGLIIIWY